MQDSVDKIIAAWLRERPDVNPEAMGVVGRISRLSRLLEAEMEKDYGSFDLSGIEFDVLATLRRSASPYELTPTQLYRSSMLSSGAMTNRIDKLEVRGFVERRPDPADRRGTRVALTPDGRAKIDAALDSHVACEDLLLAALTRGERETLAALLRSLLLSLEANDR